MQTLRQRQSLLPWFPAVVLVFASAHAGAQTLIETYKLAHEADPKFRAAQFESQASGLAVDQARAAFFPAVKFDVEKLQTHQRIRSSNNPIFGSGADDFPTDSNTLSITQALYRKDIIERYSQAQAVVRQAEFTLLAAEQELMLRTTVAYLAVLAAKDNLALSSAEHYAVRRAFDLAREKLKSGLGTITNLHDATARAAVTQAREIEARNKLSDAKQALREVTGKPIERFQSLRAEFALLTPDPPVLEKWVETALDQNLSLRARREGVEVARREIERQRAGHFPTVNLQVSRNRRDAGSTLFGGGSSVETTDVMLRVSVPIYEGGLVSLVTQEAASRHQKSQEEFEQERRAVDRQTRAAFEGTLSGARLVQALAQSVGAQQSALEAKEEGYKSGLYTLLPVLDAQRDLFLAKRDHAQARYEYLLNRLRLAQAAGTLSEVNLEGVGAALQ